MRLRISSPDVVHGFSVPGLGVNVEEILPGKPVEVEVTPQKPGRYAFACIRWCGVDHWRMRGEIEVVGPEGTLSVAPSEPPLYQRLGLDLDAMRMVTDTLPVIQPSVAEGASLGARCRRTLPILLACGRLPRLTHSASCAPIPSRKAKRRRGLESGGLGLDEECDADQSLAAAQQPTLRTAQPAMVLKARATGRQAKTCRDSARWTPPRRRVRPTSPMPAACWLRATPCCRARSCAAAWARACQSSAHSSRRTNFGAWYRISEALPSKRAPRLRWWTTCLGRSMPPPELETEIESIGVWRYR